MMPRLGHPRASVLDAFESGELPAERAVAVERHVARCAQCRRELAEVGLVRAGLAAVAIPEIESDLLPSILRRRAAGQRGGSISSSPRYPDWRRVAVALAACLVLGVGAALFARARMTRPVGATPLADDSASEDTGDLLASVGLWPTAAVAQSAAPPVEPLMLRLDARLLRPGWWSYETRTTQDGLVTEVDERDTVRIARLQAGAGSWIVTQRQLRVRPSIGEHVDSMYLGSDLHPTRRTLTRMRGRWLGVEQLFGADGVRTILRFQTGHHDRADRLPPFADSSYVTSLAAVPAVVPWSVGWRGSVREVGPFPGSQYTIELRVLGRERIEVPAGRFDCWRVRAKVGDYAMTWWVDAARHWLVKTLGPEIAGSVTERLLTGSGT